MSLKAPALLVVAGLSCPAALAQAPRVAPRAADSTVGAPAARSEPVVFRHDQFYRGLASRFGVASLPARCTYPGPPGITESRLADRIPGLGFRRNGVPPQAGEFHWFGGDGEELELDFDGTGFDLESLGFPPSGAGDPLFMPPFGDTLYLVGSPLLGARPAELVSWRSSGHTDSLLATALHANGPDGFSHTGGRLEGPIGGGLEFDGEFYRDFSDGQLIDAAQDGHRLDFELRRRVGGWPARVRFRQMRGQRSLAFRWEESPERADHRYLLADLDFEAARPDSAGEWLIRFGLRHEDQKLGNPLLTGRRTWFGRTFTLAASRLWSGSRDVVLRLEGGFRPRDPERAVPEWKSLEWTALWRRSAGRTDLAISAAWGLESAAEPAWRAALAASWRISDSMRLVAGLGRSLEAPSFLRRQLPVVTGVGGYGEGGRTELEQITHEAGSVGWIVSTSRLRLTLLGAAGRSRDLPAWPAPGELTSTYRPGSLERRYAGLGGTASLALRRKANIEGGFDYTFTNRWQGSGTTAFAPKYDWYARAAWLAHLEGTHATIGPSFLVRGAGGGSLPDDYAVVDAGLDLAVKRLVIFWRLANLFDTDYQTGGAAFDFDRHFEYGFRWELVN
jgi:hypothetical protein